MQAIIMAAGKGSRIEELTMGRPKSFLEINGKKLIEYNLGVLREIGVNKIIIVTGYRYDAFEELTKGMSDIVLKYNPFYELVNVLGSFFMGMEELSEDFLYLHADTICDLSIFERLIKSESDVTLPVEFKACDEEAMKIRRENGKIVQITKQMPIDMAEGEFIGIAAFKKITIPVLKAIVKSILAEGKLESYFESAVQKMLDETDFKISAIDIGNTFWSEIDFEEDYQRAKRAIMSQQKYKN